MSRNLRIGEVSAVNADLDRIESEGGVDLIHELKRLHRRRFVFRVFGMMCEVSEFDLFMVEKGGERKSE